MDTQEGQLRILWDGLIERYTATGKGDDDEDDEDDEGTIWHWDWSEKYIEYNVRYCGDNVVGYAIRRRNNINSNKSKSPLTSEDDDGDDAFGVLLACFDPRTKTAISTIWFRLRTYIPKSDSTQTRN